MVPRNSRHPFWARYRPDGYISEAGSLEKIDTIQTEIRNTLGKSRRTQDTEDRGLDQPKNKEHEALDLDKHSCNTADPQRDILIAFIAYTQE